MSKKRVYDDDDGRTIADMSDVTRQRLLIPRFDGGKKQPEPEPEQAQSAAPQQPRLTREESRAAVLGAMSAAMLIGLVFVVAAALLIGALLLFWK